MLFLSLFTDKDYDNICHVPSLRIIIKTYRQHIVYFVHHLHQQEFIYTTMTVYLLKKIQINKGERFV